LKSRSHFEDLVSRNVSS